MDKPKVAVIVLNWNRKDLLGRCLATLQGTEYDSWKGFVIDNGSDDGSYEMVKEKFPEFEAVHIDPNRGYEGGMNYGIGLAYDRLNPDYYVLVNNDVEFEERDWLSNLISIAKKEGAGVISPRIIQEEGWILKYYSFWPLKAHKCEKICIKCSSTEKVDAVGFPCVMISRSAFERIGLLDESYAPYGPDDMDFCVRAKEAGISVVYAGKTTVRHQNCATLKTAYNYEKQTIIPKKKYAIFLLRYGRYLDFLYTVLKADVGVFLERFDNRFRLNTKVGGPINALKLLIKVNAALASAPFEVDKKRIRPLGSPDSDFIKVKR